MTDSQVFISHSSKDKEFAERLRQGLALLGVTAWIDHRELLPGGELNQEIKEAIQKAGAFLTVWTKAAMDSDWVDRETLWALEVAQTKQGFTIIPLLLGDEVSSNAVKKVLRREVKCIKTANDPGGVQEAMAQLLTALGRRLPEQESQEPLPPAPPVEELVLLLSQAEMTAGETGKRRGKALARLEYHPAQGGPAVESRSYSFQATIGMLEADDLKWYLEQYPRWPGSVFRLRAERVEKSLPRWGQELFAQALGQEQARPALEAWQQAQGAKTHRFTVKMADPLPGGEETDEAGRATMAAAAHLLGLPWELLHDAHGFLFQQKHAVRVRRRLFNQEVRPPILHAPPLRVLMLSPRPEDESAGYIDHRVTAQPVAESLAGLGGLAEFTLLEEPSFPAMMAALREAEAHGKPFQVVHFDGHGVYLPDLGLGALCFEKPGQGRKLEKRATELKNAQELTTALRGYRIPLFFLEACQSAQAQVDPSTSVAASLLEGGGGLGGGYEPQCAGGDRPALCGGLLPGAGQRGAGGGGDAGGAARPVP